LTYFPCFVGETLEGEAKNSAEIDEFCVSFWAKRGDNNSKGF